MLCADDDYDDNDDDVLMMMLSSCFEKFHTDHALWTGHHREAPGLNIPRSSVSFLGLNLRAVKVNFRDVLARCAHTPVFSLPHDMIPHDRILERWVIGLFDINTPRILRASLVI